MVRTCLKCAVILSLAFTVLSSARAEEQQYTFEEKEFLLGLARNTLEMYLDDGTTPMVDQEALTPALLEKKPCFVTLTKRNEGLRGCMGMFYPVDTPLYENVIDRSIASAVRDPRFPQVKYEELEDIKIEISVLSPPQRLDFSSYKDLRYKLVPFEDGVILTTPYGSSTFLPQVWKELPDPEQFLSHLCRKQGAPSDYWEKHDKSIKIEVYQVVYFSEEYYGGGSGEVAEPKVETTE